ncbi:Sec-independent protein translocase protein TatB [Mycolicibacterium nivoides]|uniref:Sec-independent protein translocase protein TatB n=1 Tax=Mycolicibacterium nivoides TaxID=2487344 RepID=A0ABW9LDV0_9MYCO|nr:Sec-independent protein translocase protein TatB [Mycolicibacterium nivoides]QRY45493.1 Sec-independent protein translocase subunit TatB [Mycolicibacterium boenickei]SEQ78831.1 sec-independent protein translocase protein TatB [Mycobacterium sp. 88mf]SFF59256.1 sec-independent protein translocase protein TatB [Mycobacterium sp. 455mf]
MFANIGWGEMLVLVIAGLVILGPERLPGAIRWTSGALRQARDYVSGATSQLREDLGPEFDDLRQPLADLQKLRGMTPRAAITKHLLDGDDSFLTGAFDDRKNDQPSVPGDRPADAVNGQPAPDPLTKPAAKPAETTFDPDAT